jgi:hypothetical protein
MNIEWNNTQTLGKSKHAYYRLTEQYCPEPTVEERRWFVEYQVIVGPFDPNGNFVIVEQPFGFKTKEEAIAGAEENAKFDLQHL